jgi:Activator of Hsp90 ATPase homolog 1-like protein
MNSRETYATGASVQKRGETWTLVREPRHSPALVWQALTDPAQLREWDPFDADRSLDSVGLVTLSAVGAPKPMATQTTVKRADAPWLLEYNWGGNDLRWELETHERGTPLRLWHICFDVLARSLSGEPLGRIVGPAAMQLGGWQRLNAEYAKHFEAEA